MPQGSLIDMVGDGEPLFKPEPKVRLGSRTEVSDGHENVGLRGQSGSRFRAAGCLFIAKTRQSSIPFQHLGFLCLKLRRIVDVAHLISLIAGESWPDAMLMFLVERK